MGRPHWAALLLGAAGVAMVATACAVEDAVSSPVWWVAVLLLAGAWTLLRRRTRGVAESVAGSLDERELAIRNLAAWWGQIVMLSLGAASALLLLVAARLEETSARDALSRSGGIVLSFVIFSAAVPTFVAALLTAADDATAADDDFDDEWDDEQPGSH